MCTIKMQKVMFIIAFCVCLISACQITISDGKVNSDAFKGYGKLESKIDKLKDTITAKLDSSLRILNKVNEQVEDWKPKQSVIKNVALRKKSQQSSWEMKTRSWGNYICCATEYANDGNATIFSHTAIQNLPYWWVDLGHVYDIKRIEIINRSDHLGSVTSVPNFINDCNTQTISKSFLKYRFPLLSKHYCVFTKVNDYRCPIEHCQGNRLHDVDITVGPSLKEMSLCTHYKGPGKTAEHLVFHCNQQMSDRYVKVTIKGKEYFQLSEVIVIAPEISE